VVENYKRAFAQESHDFFGRNGDFRFVCGGVNTVHRANIIEEIGDTKDKVVVENIEAMSKDVIVALSHNKDSGGAGKYSEGTGG